MAVAHAQVPFVAANAASGAGTTVAKAYGSSITAGSVLWAVVWSYTNTETCTGVADNNGNTWVSAGGPITSVTGTAERGYIFYALNANAGATTVTATWDGTARKSIGIGEITGLAGGGELDQFIGNDTYAVSSFKITAGTFADFAQAETPIVAFYTSERNGAADSPLTEDLLHNSFNYEEFARHVTSAVTGFTAQWTIGSGASTVVAMAVSFKDAGGGGGSANGAAAYYFAQLSED